MVPSLTADDRLSCSRFCFAAGFFSTLSFPFLSSLNRSFVYGESLSRLLEFGVAPAAAAAVAPRFVDHYEREPLPELRRKRVREN